MRRHPRVCYPLGSLAVVEESRTLSAPASKSQPLRHGIEQKLFRFEKDVLLDRVDRHNSAYLPTRVFYSEGAKRARGKYFECLTVKQRAAGIVRLVINVVSERASEDPVRRTHRRPSDGGLRGTNSP